MHMQATSVEARQELDYNPIRQKTIIKKWEYVQKQYSDYHGEVGLVAHFQASNVLLLMIIPYNRSTKSSRSTTQYLPTRPNTLFLSP